MNEIENAALTFEQILIARFLAAGQHEANARESARHTLLELEASGFMVIQRKTFNELGAMAGELGKSLDDMGKILSEGRE